MERKESKDILKKPIASNKDNGKGNKPRHQNINAPAPCLQILEALRVVPNHQCNLQNNILIIF